MTSPYLTRPLRTLAQARQEADANTRNKAMTPDQYRRFKFARDERERVTGNRESRRRATPGQTEG